LEKDAFSEKPFIFGHDKFLRLFALMLNKAESYILIFILGFDPSAY